MKKLAIRLAIYVAFISYFFIDVYWLKGPMSKWLGIYPTEAQTEAVEANVYAARVYGVWIKRAEIEAAVEQALNPEDRGSSIMRELMYIKLLNQRIDNELLYFNAKYFKKTIEKETSRTDFSREELMQAFLEKQWKKRGQEFDSMESFRRRLMQIYRIQAEDKFEVFPKPSFQGTGEAGNKT